MFVIQDVKLFVRHKPDLSILNVLLRFIQFNVCQSVFYANVTFRTNIVNFFGVKQTNSRQQLQQLS